MTVILGLTAIESDTPKPAPIDNQVSDLQHAIRFQANYARIYYWMRLCSDGSPFRLEPA